MTNKTILSSGKSHHVVLFLIGIILTSVAFGIIYWNDRVLKEGEIIKISSTEGIQLVATYYSGNLPAGVMILEGFGSDQIAMKNIISEFAEWGIYCMSFDFSGHGRSDGTIGFDNAKSDVNAREILTVKEAFKLRSGLNDDQIIMIGHSMGARMALWATSNSSDAIAGLILIGCQVNLEVNTQASFFTGVDDRDLPWIQSLQWDTPATDILLISGNWDDIITPSSANALLLQLQKNSPPSPLYTRELVILPAILHSYEIYSPRVIEVVKNWAAIHLGLEVQVNISSTRTLLRIICWWVALIAIFLTLINLNAIISPKSAPEPIGSEIQIVNLKKYFTIKLILWLGAIPVTGILMSILIMFPLGQPVFNLLYAGFIGGYGILLLGLYTRGKVPGTEGRIRLFKKNSGKESIIKWNFRYIFFSIIYILMIILTIWAFCMVGLYYIFPLNDRAIWLFIYTGISMIGFFVGQKENLAIRQYNAKSKSNLRSLGLTLINFVPFILLCILYASIGSLSGFIGGIQGLIILAFVLLAGSPIFTWSRSSIVTALFQAFCLQLMVLPSTALFTMF